MRLGKTNWHCRWAVILVGLVIAGMQQRPAAALDRDPSAFEIGQFESGFCEKNSTLEGVRDRLPENSNDPTFHDPSLWLGRDIFAYKTKFGKKIFEGWLVCPSSNSDRGRIDLVVNGQLWSVLDYFDRYEFLQQFGISSDRADVRYRSGYNLRVFSRQGRSLGSYTCNASVFGSVPPVVASEPSGSNPFLLTRSSTGLPSCFVKLDDANNGLGVKSRSGN